MTENTRKSLLEYWRKEADNKQSPLRERAARRVMELEVTRRGEGEED